MAVPFLEPIDLGKLELQNARIQNLSTAPSSPVTGQLYYDTDDNVLYYWNGSTWVSASGSYSDEQAQDAVGTILADSATIDFTYTDGTPAITADVKASSITTGMLAFDPATQTELDAHISNATGAHAASAISFSPASGIAATDVQNAIVEAKTDAQAYADSVAAGLDWKASVRVATTAAGTLASSFENGDSVDGVTLATGDRILIKDQASGAENGIYTVNASGTPTRATDADTSAEVTSGMAVFVAEGTTNADTAWTLTTNDPITLGSTTLVFTQFSGLGQVTAGTGLTKTGNTINAVAGATAGSGGPGGGLKANNDDLVIDTDIVVRKYAVDVGDASSTSINVDHNLGTKDVAVSIIRNSDGVHVVTGWAATTTNRVVVTFAAAPSSAQYRVVVKA